jgi:hypothetical protein
MPSSPTPERAPERDTNEVERFFASVGSTNPFLDNRVNGLRSDDVDVDDIHREAFEQLTELAREARDERRGLGAVVWGEAGIGKSHLLARLSRWALHDRQACAIYLHNLQASPENLPRSLLRAVVSILTRGRVRLFSQTPLFDLVFALVKESRNYDTSVKHPWPVLERSFSTLVDRLSEEDSSRAALIHRTVYDVLYRFFRSAYRVAKTGDEQEAALAVRWLSGDYLDPAEARTLGLPSGGAAEGAVALADNQQIKQVLISLSRAALSNRQPFLLCFDQVDNLDDDQGSALSRFLQAVLDSAPNLLVVTTGIQASLLRWREAGVIQDSAWDRLAQFQVRLLRLTPPESRHILAARLRKVVGPFAGLEPVRQQLQDDDLFPLGRGWADAFLHDKIDLRPRDVINGAREGWRRVQQALQHLGAPAWLEGWSKQPPANGQVREGPLTDDQVRAAVDSRVADKIAEHSRQRCGQPDSLAPDADNLSGLIATLVRHLAALEIDRPPVGPPDRSFPYSLVVRRPPAGQGPEVRTGILCHASSSAVSTAAALRWLMRDPFPPERVLLVTDERCPLALGDQRSAKGRKYYETLRRRDHGRLAHIVLSVGEYARLDAIQAVLGMARSGDLEVDLERGRTRAVSERDAIESLRRQARHMALPVLGELLPDPALGTVGDTHPQ